MVEELPAVLRTTASRLATVLRTTGDRIAFVENATTGVNAVLRSLPIARGDRVLTTTHVYPAVRNAIRFICTRAGAELVELQVPFPLTSEEVLLERLEDGLRQGVSLAVLDHVTSPTGLVLPIQRMVQRCKAHGVRVLVDGAHAPGMVPLDLSALGADWYTGNAHKWLFAPKGCAFLWAAENTPTIHPTVISHDYGAPFPRAFDWTGTKDPSAWLALPAALDFMENLGFERILEHNRRLALEARDLLCEAWGTKAPAPDSMIGALAAVRCPGTMTERSQEDADAFRDRLWREERIEVPVIFFDDALWIRVSAQIYNGRPQYERLARAVMARR